MRQHGVFFCLVFGAVWSGFGVLGGVWGGLGFEWRVLAVIRRAWRRPGAVLGGYGVGFCFLRTQKSPMLSHEACLLN